MNAGISGAALGGLSPDCKTLHKIARTVVTACGQPQHVGLWPGAGLLTSQSLSAFKAHILSS